MFRSVAKVVQSKIFIFYSEGDLHESYHVTAALRSYGVLAHLNGSKRNEIGEKKSWICSTFF